MLVNGELQHLRRCLFVEAYRTRGELGVSTWAGGDVTALPTRKHVYRVTGDSMGPSVLRGDWMLVDARAYEVASPLRGDLVIARDPRAPGSCYLRRIVGLPGEEVCVSEGVLTIDGSVLPEPYLDGLPASLGPDSKTWMLRDGEYFIMGDSRAHSTDSREFGPVESRLIVGKATHRVWPPSRWSRVGAPGRF